MEFNEIYKDLLTFTKKKVLDNWVREDYNDVINSAYLSVIDKGLEPSLTNLQKEVVTIVYNYKNNLTQLSEEIIKETTEKYCKCCKEVKPIACFGVTTRKATGKRVFQTYCHECLKKIMKEKRKLPERHYHNYPEHFTKKDRAAYRMQLYKQKNHL